MVWQKHDFINESPVIQDLITRVEALEQADEQEEIEKVDMTVFTPPFRSIADRNVFQSQFVQHVDLQRDSRINILEHENASLHTKLAEAYAEILRLRGTGGSGVREPRKPQPKPSGPMGPASSSYGSVSSFGPTWRANGPSQ